MTKPESKTRTNRRIGLAAAIALGVVLLTLAAAGLGPGRPVRSAPDSEPLRVVTSIGIFADMAANVGGDAVEVTALVPAAADPHSWEPSIREMRALAAADVFIYNGLGLEAWVDRTLAAAAPRDLSVVVLSEGLQPLGDSHFHVEDATGTRGTANGQGAIGRRAGAGAEVRGDPHMWLDLRNGIAYVRRMEKAFIAAAPERAAEIEERAAAYVKELENLDAWFEEQVQAIPPQRRVLMTDHDAYVYMAERYGLERFGFVTANPDREPSAREMARLTAQLRARAVPALFAEPHVGTAFIDELARELGIPVGVLYTDAFFGDVRTYVDMMRANGEALRTFLGEFDPGRAKE